MTIKQKATAMIEIKKRFAGEVLFTCEAASLADALVKAIKEGADLRYADLRYADLSYADLSSADLRYADLRSADLSYANLRSADLRSADLRSADLSYANLRAANLRSADLSSAEGFGPKSIGLPAAGKSLLREICEMVVETPECLFMDSFHECEASHCLAGWAIHKSGAAGYALEKVTSADVAGRLLIPDAQHMFYENDETVLEWCKEQLKGDLATD